MLQALPAEMDTFQSASLCIRLQQAIIDLGHASTFTDVIVKRKVIADGIGGKVCNSLWGVGRNNSIILPNCNYYIDFFFRSEHFHFGGFGLFLTARLK